MPLHPLNFSGLQCLCWLVELQLQRTSYTGVVACLHLFEPLVEMESQAYVAGSAYMKGLEQKNHRPYHFSVAEQKQTL